MPTYDQCCRFMRATGQGFKNNAQRRVLSELCEYRRVTLKGPRQVLGKTQMVSIFASTGIVLGEPGIVGMPTLDQGGRIVADRVDAMVGKFERIPGSGLVRFADNVRYKTWNTGAMMGIVSMHEGGSDERRGKSVQGYTGQNLIIDESHECGVEVFDKLEPVVDTFALEQKETVICLGIGGYANSLMEIKYRDSEWHNIHVTPEEMIKDDPDRYGPFFEHKRKTVSPESWRQNYECLCVSGTGRLLFPKIIYNEDLLRRGMTPHWVATIDVGKEQDKTVALVWKYNEAGYQHIDRLAIPGTNYTEQVKEVARFLRQYSALNSTNVGIEVNGPGSVFADFLAKESPFAGLRRISTTDSSVRAGKGRKTKWLKQLIKDCLNGRISIKDAELRYNLESLSYEIGPDGKYKWPHSDDLSAMWLLVPMTSQPVGV